MAGRLRGDQRAHARKQQPGERARHQAESQPVGDRLEHHPPEHRGLDSPRVSDVAPNRPGATADQQGPQTPPALRAPQPHEQALQQHVGPIAQAGELAAREREGEHLVGHQQRKREGQAVAGRPRQSPIGRDRPSSSWRGKMRRKRGRYQRPPRFEVSPGSQLAALTSGRRRPLTL